MLIYSQSSRSPTKAKIKLQTAVLIISQFYFPHDHNGSRGIPQKAETLSSPVWLPQPVMFCVQTTETIPPSLTDPGPAVLSLTLQFTWWRSELPSHAVPAPAQSTPLMLRQHRGFRSLASACQKSEVHVPKLLQPHVSLEIKTPMKNPNRMHELVSCCIGALFLESSTLKKKNWV